MTRIVFGTVLAATVASASPPVPGAKLGQVPAGSGAKREKALSALFMANVGQWDQRALYYNHSGDLSYWLTKNGVVLQMDRIDFKNGQSVQGHVIQMSLVGASANPQVVPFGKKETHTDFLLGKKGNFKNVPSYAEVSLKNVYPGVSFRNYSDSGKPRYDFILEAGANPSRIQMKFDGAKSVSVDKSGNLVLATSVGPIKQVGLKAYQQTASGKKPVQVAFEARHGQVGFKLGAYDKSKALVIDPLIYGSYFGGDGAPASGNSNRDDIRSVAADANSSVYMTGWTEAPNFPVIAGGFQTSKVGAVAAFITKFRGDAYTVEYNAFISGSGSDMGDFIAVDPTGSAVWVVGRTSSANFPLVTAGSLVSTSSTNFAIRFDADANTVLNASYATYLGANTGVAEIRGFKIAPNGDLVIAGIINGTLRGAPLNSPLGGQDVYIERLNPSGTAIVWDRYFGGSLDDDMSNEALALDADGNAFIAGTVTWDLLHATQVDLSQPANQSIFETTPGIFPNGRLLRSVDAYVAKIDPAGATVYSGVLGGSSADFGRGVAVDQGGNAYVVAESGSFDFPRTAGVYGEQSLLGTVTITKISSDGSRFLYSTGLNTGGFVTARGIGVDKAGNAYITGVVDEVLIWPQVGQDPAGNPLVPLRHDQKGSIPTTSGAISSSFAVSATDIVDTKDAWLCVLDPTAANLLYGTYIGAKNNEDVHAPYVDQVGDVWVFGITDTYMGYDVFPWPPFSGTAPDPKQVRVFSELPASHITDYAFKPLPNGPFDANNSQRDSVHTLNYAGSNGTIRNGFVGTTQYQYNNPQTVDYHFRSDGYILRFRVNRPVLTSLVLNPTMLGGGKTSSTGADNTTTGTITLSGAAPAGGMDVEVTLDNSVAAQIVGSSDPAGLVVTVAAGATTATFKVKSAAVISDTVVAVKANIEGNFKIANLTVRPWLQSITISPSSVTGGNIAQGRIDLVQAAPAGGLDVQVGADQPAFATFPIGNTVTVPAGQTFVTFPIQTTGVAVSTNVSITAFALGISRSQSLQIVPARLSTVTFNPVRVADGSTAVGTITLDGAAGSPGFDVTLTSSSTGTLATTTVSFAQGEKSKTFSITANPSAVSTSITVTASRVASQGYVAQTISGILYVDVYSLASLAVVPSVVNAGSTTTGTVAITSAAPTGGVVVAITSADPTLVVVPATVTIPAGATSVDFPISTTFTNADTAVLLTATRGLTTKTATLTVKSATAALAISPKTVIGGTATWTGGVASYPVATATLSAAAPAGGLVLGITATPSTMVTLPSTVTVAAGSTTATFPIISSVVGSSTVVTITVSNGSIVASDTITVTPLVLTLSVSPTDVVGGVNPSSTGTLSINGLAAPGGITVNLSSNISAITVPTTATVAAGSGSVTFPITTSNVSAVTTGTVTASLSPLAPATATLTLRPVRLLSLTTSPTLVKGGRSLVVTATLDAPAPTGGATITLSSSVARLLSLPTTIFVPAGQTTGTGSALANRVSRSISTKLTGAYNDSSASATVTVSR